ncbi:MAG TPA: hypothetical protein VGP26_27745 [Actinophytocola sp.]|nr:hypothetical protein [Actinophytocola sp.]
MSDEGRTSRPERVGQSATSKAFATPATAGLLGALGESATSKMFGALGESATSKAFAGLGNFDVSTALVDSLGAFNPVVGVSIPPTRPASPTTTADAVSAGETSTDDGQGRRLTPLEAVVLIAAALGGELAVVMILSWPELFNAVNAVVSFDSAFVALVAIVAAVVIRFARR